MASKMNISKFQLYMKHSRTLVKARALTVVLMKTFCSFNFINISNALGNITQSRLSNLCSIGIDLILEDKRFENIIGEFIKFYAK